MAVTESHEDGYDGMQLHLFRTFYLVPQPLLHVQIGAVEPVCELMFAECLEGFSACVPLHSESSYGECFDCKTAISQAWTSRTNCFTCLGFRLSQQRCRIQDEHLLSWVSKFHRVSRRTTVSSMIKTCHDMSHTTPWPYRGRSCNRVKQ